MAFGKGKESTESVDIKRYTGVASVFVKGVNPTKAELEAFYGREIENEPNYIKDNNGIPQVRIEFLVETDPVSKLHPGMVFKSKVTFFINKQRKVGSQSGKILIIDKYGNTAWATEEEVNNGSIPMYGNGPANIAPGYRPAYDGEAELVNFLRAYLSIDSPFNYDRANKKYVWKSAEELKDLDSSLDHVEDYFNGNVKEIQDIINMQPTNKVQVLFGVKSTDKGSYQDTFNRLFLKNNNANYSKLAMEVADAQQGGSYPSTVFEVSPFHEYVVTPTDLSTPGSEPTPWD
jgi:hypothetical protein